MPCEYILRPGAEGDYDFFQMLMEVTLRAYIEQIWGWDPDSHRAMFRDNWCVSDWRVIVVDGRDAGGLSIRSSEESVHVRDMLLLPQFQGRGIGTTLMRGVMADAHAAGLPVTLFVFRINTDALRLYERLGFKVIDEDDTKYTMRWSLEKSG